MHQVADSTPNETYAGLLNRQVTFSNIISALSYALDLTEGACPGHAVRTCILGMKIGQHLGLSEPLLGELYYALLLKDVGCSSNSARLFEIVGNDEISAKRFTREADWSRLDWKQMQYLMRNAHAHQPLVRRLRKVSSMVTQSSRNAESLIRLRCEKGSSVARDLGLGALCAGAIYCLDEHWDGRGYPDRLAGDEIPLLARIVSLAQTLEVFHRQYGPVAAVNVMQRRSARWFDPSLVQAVLSLAARELLWEGLKPEESDEYVQMLEPPTRSIPVDSFIIDSICVAFANVVDAKSHYTYTHSNGVARAAVQIGKVLGLPSRDITTLRRAGLLHDIGKLSVPNCILDKKGPLTPQEWKVIHQHPYYTYQILHRITGFEEIARVAASHHEKLDGSGYHAGLKGAELCQLSRILTVADMYDALSGERPYRARLGTEEVMQILRKDAPHAIDGECVDALGSIVETLAVA